MFSFLLSLRVKKDSSLQSCRRTWSRFSHLQCCLSRVQASTWAEQIPGYAFCPRCLPLAPKETTISVATAMLFWVKHPISPWHPEVVPHLYSEWPACVVPGFFTVLLFSWNASTGLCLCASRFVLKRATHGKTNCMTQAFAAALAGFELNLSWSLSFTSEGLSLRHRELAFQILCPLSSLPPLVCTHSGYQPNARHPFLKTWA